MYLLGIDLGSSSVKIDLIEAKTGKSIGNTFYPKKELPIISQQHGWAEQHPDVWWDCVRKACHQVVANYNIDISKIVAIGIAYQMHGLVAVDEHQRVLRPSIIWCDSRAVTIGNEAFEGIGHEKCLGHLLNSPGNFTASKLKWVKENEPELYGKIHKVMLPGDFIAMKLTGDITTTATGLSEGVLWDFKEKKPAKLIMDYYGFDSDILPDLVPAIGLQGKLTETAANELGLKAGVPITYRAGDQPNNAFSLNVLEPGEVATTAGTSGVIYSVTKDNVYDTMGRVNTFMHVSDTPEATRNGVLLCINGTGILYSWLRKVFSINGHSLSYQEMNHHAATAAIGAKGLRFYPFGNGAERLLNNQLINAQLSNVDFNRHGKGEIIRGALEGIAFAMGYGFEVLKEIGAGGDVIKAGKTNLFLSETFREIFVNTTQTSLRLYNTGGSEGAARAAGLGAGCFESQEEAFKNLVCLETLEPEADKVAAYAEAYEKWKDNLPVKI